MTTTAIHPTAPDLSGFIPFAAAAQRAGTSFAQMEVGIQAFQRHMACYEAIATITDPEQRTVARQVAKTWTGTPAELLESVRTAMEVNA